MGAGCGCTGCAGCTARVERRRVAAGSGGQRRSERRARPAGGHHSRSDSGAARSTPARHPVIGVNFSTFVYYLNRSIMRTAGVPLAALLLVLASTVPQVRFFQTCSKSLLEPVRGVSEKYFAKTFKTSHSLDSRFVFVLCSTDFC